MKVSKFISPYNSAGLTSFPLRKKSGVYIIRQKSILHPNITYVGLSLTDIYGTLYRHFQVWNDRRFERVVYDRNHYLVRVIYCTPGQASKIERALIIKHQPKDNTDKFENYTSDQIDKDLKVLNTVYNAPVDDEIGTGIDVDF